ncbi:MAG: hypothetical protein WC320_01840 [Candidatus Paceibacterota bacterium]|jgi:uncharacterized membrane protein
MKGIFGGGIVVLIILTIIGVIISTGLVWLISVVKPIIIFFFGTEVSAVAQYLFCFLFIILLALILGYLIKFLPKTRFVKKYLSFTNTNKAIQNKPVVLVEFSKGIYLIGIAVENQEIFIENKRKSAKRVFLPSSPVPFTGWTIIVETDKITPIDFRYQELLSLVSSWGSLGLKPMVYSQNNQKNSSQNNTKSSR